MGTVASGIGIGTCIGIRIGSLETLLHIVIIAIFIGIRIGIGIGIGVGQWKHTISLIRQCYSSIDIYQQHVCDIVKAEKQRGHFVTFGLNFEITIPIHQIQPNKTSYTYTGSMRVIAYLT